MYGRRGIGSTKAVNHMTIKSHLAELERQHKALEHEIAEALEHRSTDDLKIAELKRRKLILIPILEDADSSDLAITKLVVASK
jgi:hypothetical protein